MYFHNGSGEGKKPTCVAPWALNWVDLKDFYKSHIKVKVSATYLFRTSMTK